MTQLGWTARDPSKRCHSPSVNSGAGQPTEESEDGGKGVNTKDGANELPRRPDERTRVRALSHTGDQDDPRLRQCDLEEQDLLDTR